MIIRKNSSSIYFRRRRLSEEENYNLLVQFIFKTCNYDERSQTKLYFLYNTYLEWLDNTPHRKTIPVGRNKFYKEIEKVLQLLKEDIEENTGFALEGFLIQERPFYSVKNLRFDHHMLDG